MNTPRMDKTMTPEQRQRFERILEAIATDESAQPEVLTMPITDEFGRLIHSLLSVSFLHGPVAIAATAFTSGFAIGRVFAETECMDREFCGEEQR